MIPSRLFTGDRHEQDMPPAHATPADALSFVDDVKEHFLDAPERYAEFMGIMKDFKTEELDTLGAVGRIGQLLAGAPRLVRAFNTFLPPAWSLEPASDGSVVLAMPDGTKKTVAPANAKMQKAQAGLEIPPFKPK